HWLQSHRQRGHIPTLLLPAGKYLLAALSARGRVGRTKLFTLRLGDSGRLRCDARVEVSAAPVGDQYELLPHLSGHSGDTLASGPAALAHVLCVDGCGVRRAQPDDPAAGHLAPDAPLRGRASDRA